jgi:putative flippase GtrA
MIAQLARFGTVGVANTLLTAATYATLRAVGLPALVAAPAGFAVGAANGYLCNGRWTFRTRSRAAFRRYAAVQAGALVATDAILAAGVPYLAVLATVTLVAFAACRWWVFGR